MFSRPSTLNTASSKASPDGGTHVSLELIMWLYPTEVKNLKQLVRNVVDPDRDLGHVDRDHGEKKAGLVLGKKPSMLTGQSDKPKAEESTLRYRRPRPSTNISKASQDGPELAMIKDVDAAAARGAASEGEVLGGELCGDCK